MQSNRLASKWSRRLLALAALAAIGGVGSYFVIRGRANEGSPRESSKPNLQTAVSVQVVSPRPGGIDRLCLQPGSLEPIAFADVYSKVSGFLAEQNVDIGYPVKAGDVLARISVPEYEKQVKQDAADVVKAELRVDQMKAAIASAEADLGTATATIALAQAEKQTKVAYRAYLDKQRGRINTVVANGVLDAQVGDEMQKEFQSSVSADLAAGEAINVARQKETAARARVKQAEADLRYADAEVAAAKAHLERSQVMLDYTVIRSEYTGVVTKRNFSPGDFIRSADAGGERMPLLAVERTDIMRVIIQIPERDVPFVDVGDPAIVSVDALPGVMFKTHGADKVEVSRKAVSEDPVTRMMRTEVHIKNPDGKLRRGMFGRVTLHLETGAPGAFRLPTAALSGKADNGKGMVRVVRDNKVVFVPVQYVSDNGSEIEVVSGVTQADRVIVGAAGTLTEGVSVAVADAKSTTH